MTRCELVHSSVAQCASSWVRATRCVVASSGVPQCDNCLDRGHDDVSHSMEIALQVSESLVYAGITDSWSPVRKWSPKTS